MKINRTIIAIIGTILFALNSTVSAEQIESNYIGNVYYLGTFKSADTAGEKTIAEAVAGTKSLGRLHLSNASMEFSLKIAKDYEQYVNKFVFSKDDGAQAQFNMGNKVLSLRFAAQVWLFLREDGFDLETRKRVSGMFHPK